MLREIQEKIEYNKEGGKDRDEEKRREVGHRKEGNIRENGKIGGGNEEEGGRGKKRKGKGAICLSERVNRMEERSKRELEKGGKG